VKGVCIMLETLVKVFFRVCENRILFCENWVLKLLYVKGCYLLSLGVRQEKGTRECE